MSRVRLRKVTVEGFRAFVERQSTPDLPKTGLIGIRGRNLDTNGSSGAGKSSIAYAICYALGLLKAPYSAAKLKSKWAKAPMQVELELEADGVPVTLRRGKVTSIQVGEEPEVAGSVEAVEERLGRLLGLDSELLRALTFRQQKKPGLFLSMKDLAKKEFLGALLGLQEVEKRIEEATPKGNQAKVEAEKLLTARTALEGQLRVPAEPSFELIGPLREDITTISDRWQVADATLSAANLVVEGLKAVPPPAPPDGTIIQQLRAALQECDQRISTARKAQAEKVESARKLAEQAQLQFSRLKEFIAGEQAVEGELKRVRAKITQAEGEKCPTCAQAWASAGEKLDEWRRAAAEIEARLAQIGEAKGLVPSKQAELVELASNFNKQLTDPEMSRLSEVRGEIERRLASEQAALNASATLQHAGAKAALADANAAVAACKLELGRWEAELARVKYLKKATEERNEQMAAQYQRDLDNYKTLLMEVERLDQLASSHMTSFARETDLAAALKGFLGSIFDEVLVEISAETNELLRGLRNVATTTVSFVSDKTTEKGAVKQQIRPVVLKNGVELDWEVDLSGGQGTSLELAVDLAVARVVGRRTGRRPGWLILDEAFEGHDMAVKESCLEVLQKAAQDCAILVVDHASELREYFTSFIDVESSNEVARILP